jgi:uncharacterized membrane protein
MYSVVVFAHVLSVFGFLLAHGASTAIAFKVQGERKAERIHALLDLSRTATSVSSGSLALLLIAGIIAGLMGHWWGHGWIWASLALFALIGVAMTVVGSRPLDHLRQAIGATQPGRAKASGGYSTPDALTDEQLSDLLAAVHPMLLTVLGGGGFAIILWLMMYKPF